MIPWLNRWMMINDDTDDDNDDDDDGDDVDVRSQLGVVWPSLGLCLCDCVVSMYMSCIGVGCL